MKSENADVLVAGTADHRNRIGGDHLPDCLAFDSLRQRLNAAAESAVSP